MKIDKISTNILYQMIKQGLNDKSLRDAQIRYHLYENDYEWVKNMYELCNLPKNIELKETNEYRKILSILRDEKLEQLGI